MSKIPKFLTGDLSKVQARQYLSDFDDDLAKIEFGGLAILQDPVLFLNPKRAFHDMKQHRELWVATYSCHDCDLFKDNRITRLVCGIKPDCTVKCKDVRLLSCLHSKLFLGVANGHAFCAYIGSFNCVNPTTLNITLRIDAPQRVGLLTQYYEMLWKHSKPLRAKK